MSGPSPRVRADLFKTFRKIDPRALGFDEEPISDSDVSLGSLEGRVKLAFGVYSEDGLANAARSYGTFRRLSQRGLGEIQLRLQLDDPFRPNIQLWSDRFDAPIVDVTVSRCKGSAVGLSNGLEEAPLLYLESVTLQHPGRSFDWSRPPLPGQAHPGLSMSGEILELVLLVARRVGDEGLALRPSSFHAARIYERHFQFIDGRAEGVFRALRHSFELRPLWLLAWALELGCVKEAGHVFHWQPWPMLAPLDERLAAPFNGTPYLDQLGADASRKFEIDFELLKDRFPWELMPKGPPPPVVAALLKKK